MAENTAPPIAAARSPGEDINNKEPGGLGKYFSTVTLYDYERPNMFATAIPRRMQSIYLPLPDGLRDATSAEWTDASQGALASMFMNGRGENSIAQGALDAAGAALIGSGPGELGSIVKGFVEKAGPLGKIAAKALDNMLPADALNAFVQQSIIGGAAQNPNPTLIFKGPTLRSYSLAWTFAPRSTSESTYVKDIIRALKQATLPMPRYQGTMAVLAYPKLAQVNFYPWDNNSSGNKYGWSNRSIIKYKTSAVTSVSVNYAPSNVPAFYAADESPAIITINVDFKEVEYLVAEDWGEINNFWSGRPDAPDAANGVFQEGSLYIQKVINEVKIPLENAVKSLTSAATGFGEVAPTVQPVDDPVDPETPPAAQ